MTPSFVAKYFCTSGICLSRVQLTCNHNKQYLGKRDEDLFRKVIVFDIGIQVYQEKLASSCNITSESITNG